MSYTAQRWLAVVVVIAGIALQFPVQTAIDRDRNTVRVTMYPAATEAHVQAVVDGLKQHPGVEPWVRTERGADGKPRQVVLAVAPMHSWGASLQELVEPVQNLPRVAKVAPGMNEQGLPLDRIQELNVQDVGIVVIGALIGGFRKSAANVLWLQNEVNWESQKTYRTLPLARAVTTLDPNFVDAWVLTCWHLAYNMSVEAKDPDEAAELIRQGLDFAEQGLKWNSTKYDIYQEIGWTYYDKLQNYPMAVEYFKRAINHPHPSYLERMIAHAYERTPDIPNALKWYQISLDKYGTDNVAVGAITTINERYVPAWREYEKGNLDAALVKLKEHWQEDDPLDTIGMHFQARIYEAKAERARAAGDEAQVKLWYERAFRVWLDSATHNASNRLARRRVLTLAENFGWQAQVPKGFNDVGLPESWASKAAPSHGRGSAETEQAPAQQ